MRLISKIIAASAAALCTPAFVALSAPTAQAGAYCTQNTSGMRGCGYTTLEQCQAAVAGIFGTCFRDPFLKAPEDALAYQPKPAHVVKRPVTR